MSHRPSPTVSALVAARDAEATLRPAVLSLLQQELDGGLEVIVVDDASTDASAALLESIDDDRLVVVRNSEQLGLAASLNRGLAIAQGRYVARLDADDLALPGRLARQVAEMRRSGVGILGSSIVELSSGGRLGKVHELPHGPRAVRWHSLFRTAFFHPSVLVDRELLEHHELRYDPDVGAAQDYELWARVLDVADGDNLLVPLTLKRVHDRQISAIAGDAQLALLERVASPRLSALAPELSPAQIAVAWRLGVGLAIDEAERDTAAQAFRTLLGQFERAQGRSQAVRTAAARHLALLGPAGVASALALDPLVVARALGARRRRRRTARAVAPGAARWLRGLGRPGGEVPLRVVAVQPEPTPYRSPLFDRLAARSDLDLTVVYAARTVADRSWSIDHSHRSLVLDGVKIPGLRRALRHDYPVTPGIGKTLRQLDPDVAVVTGWSMFASQATVLWCRRRHVPYVLIVESHDRDPRAAWRRAVKGAIVPRVVRGASGILATGSLVDKSMITRGAEPSTIHRFANTIDVEEWAAQAEIRSSRRAELRARLGANAGDCVVLSVARLVHEKGLDTLLEAVARVADPRLLVVVAGSGPERASLEQRAARSGVRLRLLGDLEHDDVVDAYVAADVFALLSRHEPWGVVVNEAAACGLPLVLSEDVGAAADLLVDGESGMVVPVDDENAAAAVIRTLADDEELRHRLGTGARRIVAGWSYGPSIDGFMAAVLQASGRRVELGATVTS